MTARLVRGLTPSWAEPPPVQSALRLAKPLIPPSEGNGGEPWDRHDGSER
jgi:hypothetical protein